MSGKVAAEKGNGKYFKAKKRKNCSTVEVAGKARAWIPHSGAQTHREKSFSQFLLQGILLLPFLSIVSQLKSSERLFASLYSCPSLFFSYCGKDELKSERASEAINNRQKMRGSSLSLTLGHSLLCFLSRSLL